MSQQPYLNQSARDEHRKENNAKAVDLYGWDSENLEWVRISVDENGNVGKPLQQITQDVDVDNSYVGLSSPGSTTDEAVWQIRKIVNDNGTTTSLFADSTPWFDKVWDSRAGYSYALAAASYLLLDTAGNTLVDTAGNNLVSRT